MEELDSEETRHLAKRQLTWFRREKDVIWFDKKEYKYNDTAILDAMCHILKEKGICDESTVRK